MMEVTEVQMMKIHVLQSCPATNYPSFEKPMQT